MSQAAGPVAAQSSPRLVAALLIGAAVLFLTDLGGTDLWAPDEPRYAHVADEVFSMRHGPEGLVLLHLNGQPYTQKPPLYYWLASIASLPGGRVSEWSARLPSALAGLAAVWLTFLLGRAMFDGRTGAWAAAILATVFDFAFLARHARLDVLLTLAVVAALLCFWRLDRGRGSPRANVAGLHAAMGLGILVKGPVVPGLLAVTLIGLCAWDREFKLLARFKPALGVPLLLAVILPWLIAIARHKLADEMRLRMRARASPLDEASGSHDPIADAGTRLSVRQAVEALGEEQRELLHLVFVLGFNYAEAAEVLEVPEGTVKSRMFTLKKLLAGRLATEVGS